MEIVLEKSPGPPCRGQYLQCEVTETGGVPAMWGNFLVPLHKKQDDHSNWLIRLLGNWVIQRSIGGSSTLKF